MYMRKLNMINKETPLYFYLYPDAMYSLRVRCAQRLLRTASRCAVDFLLFVSSPTS